MPRAEMEVLAYHECVPGHHLQVARAQSNPDLPQFRRFFEFTPASEGWAVYAEQELAGRLGKAIGHAIRLVVDTGIHHFGWDRRRAEDYYVANSMLLPEAAARAVDRHIAMPGLGLAYGVGLTKFREIRARAGRAAAAR